MEKTFTTANFDNEVLQADKPVLVDFYEEADLCRLLYFLVWPL